MTQNYWNRRNHRKNETSRVDGKFTHENQQPLADHGCLDIISGDFHPPADVNIRTVFNRGETAQNNK